MRLGLSLTIVRLPVKTLSFKNGIQELTVDDIKKMIYKEIQKKQKAVDPENSTCELLRTI